MKIHNGVYRPTPPEGKADHPMGWSNVFLWARPTPTHRPTPTGFEAASRPADPPGPRQAKNGPVMDLADGSPCEDPTHPIGGSNGRFAAVVTEPPQVWGGSATTQWQGET